MYDSKVMASPCMSTAHFPIEMRFECQIAELTYPDDLHKILQLLLLKVSRDHELFPACVFPPMILLKQRYHVDFLGHFLQTMGDRAQNLDSCAPPAATHTLAHGRTWWHVRRPAQKPFLLANSFAHQECILVPFHYIPK